jgi:Glycosyl transferases group 1
MRALGWAVLLWDGRDPERTFDEFQPDLYIADVRYRHRVPDSIRVGRCQVVMTVDQWANPWAFPVLARYGYRTRRTDVRWVRKLDPVFLYHHASPKGIERGWINWTTREGREVISLPLGGDPLAFYAGGADEELSCDLGFLGQYSPYKAPGLHEYLLSYAHQYKTLVFGPGWPPLVTSRPSLPPARRNGFFSAAKVVPCIHEPHARLYGVEVTERLFKVPLAGGFTITDPVSCIYGEGYFESDEVPMAHNGREMAKMVDHFVRNPADRLSFIDKARRRVLTEHTYFHRIAELMDHLRRPDLSATARDHIDRSLATGVWSGSVVSG